MEEADDIMLSVQTIFETVQADFERAAAAMKEGLPAGVPVRWTGLEGADRTEMSRRLREEVSLIWC